MITISIKDLIYLTPELLTLFIPGFVFMCVFLWIKSRKLDLSLLIVWSLTISLIIRALCATVHSYIFVGWVCPEPLKILVYVTLGGILPFGINYIMELKYFKKLLKKTVHKTLNTDILDDLIDYDNPMIMRVYLKSSEYLYIGRFLMREESKTSPYISLIDYGVLNKNTLETIYDSMENEELSTAVIKLDDIERIEFIYQDNSSLWKDIHPWNSSTK